MTTDAGSYLDYITAPDQGELSRLQVLAEQQVAAEKAVKEAEQALDKAKNALAEIAERQIPELMDRAGMANFTTAGGLTIAIDEKIRASIAEEHKPAAFAWLAVNGHGGLIDRTLAVKLGRGQDELAAQIRETLKDYDVQDKEGVHAGTLSAWVREQLAEGKPIPQELISVYRQRASKVGYPKARKF